MTFKKFELFILLQILLITVNSFVIAWTLLQEHMKISTFYFSAILIFQIILLYLHITKQNNVVFRFLESMKHRDELSRLSEKDNAGSHRQLRKLLNEIAESYSQVKIEKESEHFYFLNTIKHVNVGLLSFDNQGKIELMNKAAEALLGLTKPRHISAVDTLFREADATPSALEPGKPRLVKYKRDDELLHLSIQATVFMIKERQIKLVSLQDIRNEIQQEEIEIWQKLIRVLTHEIMNSAGPITSLSATLTDTFREDIKPHKIGEKLHDKVLIGLQAIQKRSRGLANFVQTYRSLTKLPQPVFTTISANDLFNQIHLLMQEELANADIELYLETSPQNLQLTIDEKLFSQVVINVLKNAISALAGRPNKSIRIMARGALPDSVNIIIEDNGTGISEDLMERIFVPFFTTREDGSGIGLSLSRQIMNLHHGSINIRSREGEGTVVKLTL